jgi:hypothetical protein
MNDANNFTPNNSVKVIDGRTYTHRTRCGYLARILCTDVKSDHNSIAFAYLESDTDREVVTMISSSLRYLPDHGISNLDLVEGAEDPTDWSKVAVDTPIWVQSHGSAIWRTRHFAGVQDNAVLVWDNGRTSHTIENPIDKSVWGNARLTDPTKK